MAAVLEDGLVRCSYILQAPVVNSIKLIHLRFRNGGKGMFGVDQLSAANTDDTDDLEHNHVIEGLTILLFVYVKVFLV
jgi:hypothetical protein